MGKEVLDRRICRGGVAGLSVEGLEVGNGDESGRMSMGLRIRVGENRVLKRIRDQDLRANVGATNQEVRIVRTKGGGEGDANVEVLEDVKEAAKGHLTTSKTACKTQMVPFERADVQRAVNSQTVKIAWVHLDQDLAPLTTTDLANEVPQDR